MKLTKSIIGVGLFQLVYHQDVTLLLKIFTVIGIVTLLGSSCHCSQLDWVHKFMKCKVKKYTCKVHTTVLYI